MASAGLPAGAARRRRALAVAAGALLLPGLLAAAGCRPRAAAPTPERPAAVPEDPRLTVATPYRNVRPEVRYVGDEACARCHPGQAETYRRHPMGRFLAPVASAAPVERYGEAARNPFEALGFRYRVERRGGQVVHRETAADPAGRAVAEAEAEVRFAVGSGARGRSYLIDHDGYLFESPITWYAEKGAWDLSPGYRQHHHHFGRPVPADCLFCHSNRALPVADTENRYRPPVFEGYAIGCERCHGPGELHVRSREAGEVPEGTDATIVNPGRLEPVLRDAVCEQCHLVGVTRVLRHGRQPFDYRPGLPLDRFLTIFVKPPDPARPQKFVGQVEQMHASRCFQAGDGRMGCVSCHDPHVLPAAAERVAYHRGRCLKCHADRGCSVPAAVRRKTSQDDNCLTCHMPVGESDIQHHSITDHRIPRRPGEPSPPGPVAAAGAGGEILLRPFHGGPEVEDTEAARDLALALMDRVERYPGPVRRRLGELALQGLEAALRADPADVPALDARAHARWAVGDVEGAAAAFEEVLAQSPRREITLQCAAALAMERGRAEDAVPYWERAVEVNPWRYEFQYGLATAQAECRNWPAVARACRQALRLNPAGTGSRLLLVRYYLETGDPGQARAEFARLLGLHPPDEAALRRWFARQLR